MRQQKMVFEVNRCNNDERKKHGLSECYDDEKINDFLKNMVIDTWAIYDEIDFDKYGVKPVRPQ